MFDEIFSRRVINKKSDITNIVKRPKYLIHVAGTNGKGSTCSYLECVLMSKYKVGKFSSPHILRPNERITINQEEISNSEIFEYYNKFKHLDLGFFDFFFLIAMQYFYDKNVDIAIVEVGIGGRFDSTNILNYDIALITNISFDHTNMLGNSLDEIAYQKAGICKNNTKTFYTDIKLKNEIEKLTNDSKFISPNNNFKLKLVGEHQYKNFALTYEVFKLFNFSDDEIKQNLNNFKLSGRIEYIKPNILIDVSHNVDSIKCLVNHLDSIDNKKINMYFSCLIDKDIDGIYDVIKKFNPKFYILDNVKRARTKNDIPSYIPIANNISIADDCLNVFCGSFYFISYILNKKIDLK